MVTAVVAVATAVDGAMARETVAALSLYSTMDFGEGLAAFAAYCTRRAGDNRRTRRAGGGRWGCGS